MVAQSDWLPMMIATGFDGIIAPVWARSAPRKEARDYRNDPSAGKAKAVFFAVDMRFAWGAVI